MIRLVVTKPNIVRLFPVCYVVAYDITNSFQYGLKSVRYLGAKIWNTLPFELRNAPSKASFKTKMKNYLLNKVDR